MPQDPLLLLILPVQDKVVWLGPWVPSDAALTLTRQELMSSCWQQNPRLRPTFTQILNSIQKELRPSFRLLSFYHSPECQGGCGLQPTTDAESSSPPTSKGASDCSLQNGGPEH